MMLHPLILVPWLRLGTGCVGGSAFTAPAVEAEPHRHCVLSGKPRLALEQAKGGPPLREPGSIGIPTDGI